jgi:hypothetical protein
MSVRWPVFDLVSATKHVCRIFLKIGTADFYKTFLSSRAFLKYQLMDSATLLKGITEFVTGLTTFLDESG